MVGGRSALSNPVESGLGGVVFYDGDNVYSNINLHQFVSNYSNFIGFGYRYHTPVGPIRFDIAHLVNAPPGLNSTQYFCDARAGVLGRSTQGK